MRKILIVLNGTAGGKKSVGVVTATQELFGKSNTLLALPDDKEELLESAPGAVVLFSGFDAACAEIIPALRASGAKIAVYWHYASGTEVDSDIGANALSLRKELARGTIDLFISCRRYMAELFGKLYGVPSYWIMNNTRVVAYKGGDKIGVGNYAGTSYWVKNGSSQFDAASLMGMPIDLVPMTPGLEEKALLNGVQDLVTGVKNGIPHEEFLERMAEREIVLYCTYSEAAPMIPLEALNQETLVITGPAHDYWLPMPGLTLEEEAAGAFLREKLVVNEVDNPMAIADKALAALKEREAILENYRTWKRGYDRIQERNIQELLRRLMNL